METRASYVLVGAFVLTLVGAAFAVVVFLARVQFEERPNPYLVRFSGAVTGLAVGSPVRYRGVPVGSVTSIRIDPDDIAQIDVMLDIAASTPIKEDTVATIGLQGITGIAYVQLSGGTQESPPLRVKPGQRYPEIPSMPSQLEQVLEDLPRLFRRAVELVARLTEALDERNVKAFSQTLSNVRDITGAVAGRTDGIDRILVEGVEAARALRRAAETMDRLATKLDRRMGPLGDGAQNVMTELQATLVDLRRASAAFAHVTENLDKLVAENRRPLRDFSANGLYEFSQFVTEMRVLVANLTRLTKEIERDPARFFFGDSQKGFETQ